MVGVIVLIMLIVFITMFVMVIMVIICMVVMVLIHLWERKCVCNVLSMNLSSTFFIHGKGCCFIRTYSEEFTQF